MWREKTRKHRVHLQHLSDHVVQDSSMFEVNKLHLCVKTCLDLKAWLACNLLSVWEDEGVGEGRMRGVEEGG